MKMFFLLCGLCIALSASIFSQTYKGRIDSLFVPALSYHFEPEYLYDKPVEPHLWSTQEAGLQVSFASTDKLYFRTEVPGIDKEALSWEGSGWKGERLNTQVLVWSPDTLKQVQFVVGDLTNGQGKILSRNNIRVSMVRYVLSNYPYNDTNTNCAVSPYKNAFLMPDRFETFDRFDLPAKTLRPVWLSVNIPAGTEPGTYKGNVEVKSENGSSALQLNIKVQNQVLPPPKDWKYRLDLWQNPWVIAGYYHLRPWSDEHKALLKKHLSLYADAGGKYITTYVVHSPWADNSYMIEGTMVEWIKLKNGSWKFDYRIFDEYVQLAMETGITKAITIYTPVPWGNRFRYLDEETNNYITETWEPDSETYKTIWNIFLTDLKAHLRKKGWLEKTYIGINENTLEQTLAAIKVVRDHSKSWKITYAGNWHKELDELLDDYSFLYGFEPDMKQVKQRSGRGFTSTYYVCCNPAKPNNFVFSPPVEGRWISWYASAMGYDGFLRWAYDAWPVDPARDARHTLWPAGDCFLVYPGASSNIRYEKLREGIVDFEKISIIRALASKSSDRKIIEMMNNFELHLQSFTMEKEFEESKLSEAIERGRRMIGELGEALGKVRKSGGQGVSDIYESK